MFLQVCVCPQGGRGVCLSACWDTPQTRHPPEQTPPRPDTPWTRHPPWEQTPPRSPPPSPREADCSIRLTSGRYASYWNAFLFILCFVNLEKHTAAVDRSLDSSRMEFRSQCARGRQCFVECAQSQSLQPSLHCRLSKKCSESSNL